VIAILPKIAASIIPAEVAGTGSVAESTAPVKSFSGVLQEATQNYVGRSGAEEDSTASSQLDSHYSNAGHENSDSEEFDRSAEQRDEVKSDSQSKSTRSHHASLTETAAHPQLTDRENVKGPSTKGALDTATAVPTQDAEKNLNTEAVQWRGIAVDSVHGHSEEALQLRLEARVHFEEALRLKANYEKAHEGLSYVLSNLGEEQEAALHRRAAFQNRCIIPMPYRGRGVPVPVLQLVSTTGGNVPLPKFVDDRIFQRFIVLPEFYDPKIPLPAHQLVINGIGDAELSSEALKAAESLLNQTKSPVINAPGAVLATGRSNNASRLSAVAGVVAPITALLPREQLSDADAATMLTERGFEFPLLLRTPGFHTGQHFLKVENIQALPASLADLPGSELIVMQYLDARGSDGKTRKYRVMMIDGQIYPLHLAISNHWKIHYFTAEMADNPQHRAEDAAFLDNMPGVLGPLAVNALSQIQRILGLDYGGIDFGVNAKGQILVFEANATMVVNAPESEERWSYRRPAYQRIRQAIEKMLLERACPNSSPEVKFGTHGTTSTGMAAEMG
jgi:glutathione synthase/RimK-type ligase-like ATP-grasp enzyme